MDSSIIVAHARVVRPHQFVILLSDVTREQAQNMISVCQLT